MYVNVLYVLGLIACDDDDDDDVFCRLAKSYFILYQNSEANKLNHPSFRCRKPDNKKKMNGRHIIMIMVINQKNSLCMWLYTKYSCSFSFCFFFSLDSFFLF